jgi:hypothetical protein
MGIWSAGNAFAKLSDKSDYRQFDPMNDLVLTAQSQPAAEPITGWQAFVPFLAPPIVATLAKWAQTAHMRDATRRAYNADLDSFSAWCRLNGQSWLPASSDAVVAYLQAEIAGGWLKAADGAPELPKSVATVKRRTAAISRLHRAAGLENPCDCEAVRGVLAGDADRRGGDQHQAEGLRQGAANQIEARVLAKIEADMARPRDLRDLAVVLVGRDLLCRPGELPA